MELMTRSTDQRDRRWRRPPSTAARRRPHRTSSRPRGSGLGTGCCRARRGTVMLVAMVCLTLSVGLLAGLLRLAATQHKQVRYELMRLQADWLAEAGIERAVHRLQNDADYAGETWKLGPDDLDQAAAGQVTIQVRTLPDNPGVRQVQVQAVYPLAAYRHASRTKQVLVKTFTAL